MLLCFGRKQKRLNVFSHILDLRSKEASDERRGDCHLFNGIVRRVFKKRGGGRKGGNCDQRKLLRPFLIKDEYLLWYRRWWWRN